METESTWAYTTRMRKLMRRSQIVVDEKARALSEKYNNPNNQEYDQEASGLTTTALEGKGFPQSDTVFEA